MGNGGLKKVSKEVRREYEAHGQAHVFRFLDAKALSAPEEDVLARQTDEITAARARELFEASTAPDADADAEITPLDPSEVASADAAAENAAAWSAKAFEAISRGEIAFIVLSGGQGTRLGFSRAKGMYDVGLPSGKSLFQLQAERVLKLQRLVADAHPDRKATCVVPWYVMTSPLNDADTRAYFAEHKFFGLAARDVRFFAQGTLPCMTPEGKFILEDTGRLAVAPDGNGGIYRAMQTQGVFADMRRRGVKLMHVTSVDNALVRCADPVFVGYALEQDAQVGNKGCPKVSWDEKVGVMARRGGRFSVVEYSEMDEAAAQRTAADGRLLFSSGNICNHVFSLEFLERTALPALANRYHVARKKIPCVDMETGAQTKPSANNGIKLEMFIFDVFPLADRMAVLECARSEEFAPVKNAPGDASDSPDTARAMTFALHRGWLEAAGANLEPAKDAASACEVSPLVSLHGEGLADICAAVDALRLPLLLRLRAEAPKSEAGAARSSVSVDGAAAQVTHFVSGAGVNVYEV